MRVYLNENVLVLEAQDMTEAAIVGMIRQELATAALDESYVKQFGAPDFDDSTGEDRLGELHFLIGTHKTDKQFAGSGAAMEGAKQ